jgi:hypothetical protein
MEAMKADVADLAVRLHSVDARLDFTEKLLGGVLSGTRPPEALSAPENDPELGKGNLEEGAPQDREDAAGA